MPYIIFYATRWRAREHAFKYSSVLCVFYWDMHF